MNYLRLSILVLCGLSLIVLFAGCPGMPGASTGREQQMPPGMLPPAGLTSGGARTLMGTTITPPDNSILLVKFSYVHEVPGAGEWQSCQRIIPMETLLLVEGLNFDGRAKGQEKDVNRLLPLNGLSSFQWKYELKPISPPSSKSTPEKAPVKNPTERRPK